MRLSPATALGLTGLSLVAASTACIFPRAECNAICETTFDVSAHVPGTAASLAGASVTFCRNGACASATLGGANDAVAPVALTGAPFSAQATVSDEADGFTIVGISLDVAGLTEAAGDTYSVKVVDATGDALLDVSRPVQYDVVQSCGPTCLDYSTDVYPTSASGIACGDKSCVSGATFTGAFTTSDTSDMVEVSLCRNSVCGTGALSLMGVAPEMGGMQQPLTGPLAGLLGVEALTSVKFDFQIYLRDDAAALSDTDTFTLTVEQGTTTLASWSGAAPYVTTFPNGMQCDAFPCRLATVNVP